MGAVLARRRLERAGVEQRRVERIEFFIRHHLLLPLTAIKADLHDEAAVAAVASRMETRERLAAMLLFVTADAQATGPKAWSEWLAMLLDELTSKADRMLAFGMLASPHAAQALMQTRDKVRQLWLREAPLDVVGTGEDTAPWPDAAGLERRLASVPPRYLLAREPAEVARHLRMVLEYEAACAEDVRRKPAGRGGLGVNRLAAEPAGAGLWRVFVVGRGAPGFLATVVGAMTLQGLEILAVDAATAEAHGGSCAGEEGVAMDVFTVGGLPDALYPDELFTRISLHVQEALRGRLDLAHQLAKKRASPLAPTPTSEALDVALTVAARNDCSDFHTLVEVEAPARLGVTFDALCALRDAGVDVAHAKIAAHGAAFTMAFMVETVEGGALPPAHARAVESALREALSSTETP